jgi:serine protease AprX
VKISVIIIPLLFCTSVPSRFVNAQVPAEKKFWIFLHDKDEIDFHSADPAQLGISERALKRRSKALSAEKLIDIYDIPVSHSAIERIERTGAHIRTVSRWLNAVSVEAGEPQLNMLKTLPGIKAIRPVAVFKRTGPQPAEDLPVNAVQRNSNALTLNYGHSWTQLGNMKVVDLHAVGVNGSGVIIGMLDDGFNNYRTHTALKGIDVVATYDFIHNIEDVNRQTWESSTQGNHGAGTLSAIGGYAEGQLIGAAYGASFLLAKTEMDSSGQVGDFHSEEDTFVAGLEWAEQLGADIVSSSLGYKEFQTPPYYTTSDLDGRTTLVAQGAVIAARKGVLVVTAMGNEGSIVSGLHTDSTLMSPADADSIIAVGAVSSAYVLAAFSSCGPTADGRFKPDVVAQGVSVYWASGSSTSGYIYENGTSCSTPLAAGAAALILSAHPELTNMQVREALLNTAVHVNDGTVQTSVYPNNYFGSGFVDALEAAEYFGPVFGRNPDIRIADSRLDITTFILSKGGILSDSSFFYYRREGGEFDRAELYPTDVQGQFSFSIPGTEKTAGYFSVYENPGNRYLFPSDTSRGLLEFAAVPPAEYTLLQNFPNPFNGTTTILFDSPAQTEADVSVFNLLGQHIKTVFHGIASRGRNMIYWDGTNEPGYQSASGVYFVRLKISGHVQSKRMLYIR